MMDLRKSDNILLLKKIAKTLWTEIQKELKDV